MFGWLTAIGEVFKAIGIGLGMIRDKELRNEGAIAQREKTNEGELKVIRDGNSAADNDGVISSVRDEYEIPRGP